MRTDMVDGIVLDFDGVIVNSEPVHLRASQTVLSKHGLELSAHEYYERYVGLDDVAMFTRIAKALGRPRPWIDAVLRDKVECVASLMADGTPLFPGVADHIRELGRTLPIGIASGAVRAEIERALGQAGLSDVVQVIVAAGETPRGKPYGDPYRRAVTLLGQLKGALLDPGRVVAVEDTLQGLQSAATAGLRTIAVTTTFPADALRRADLVVRDLLAVTRKVLDDLVQDTGISVGIRTAAG